VHGEFLFATQAWFYKSSIVADILGFEVSLDRQSIRPWTGAEVACCSECAYAFDQSFWSN
jgi:hypothetical protein